MPMPWFRVYSETLNDRKLTRAARVTGLQQPTILGFWIGILCLANDSPQRGKLLLAKDLPLTTDDIAEELGADASELAAAMDAFATLEMICKQGDMWQITKWNSRQFVSDNSTERVRKHRAQQTTQQTRNVTETFPSNAPDTEADTDTEADADADATRAATAAVFTHWQSARGGATTALDCEQVGDMCDEYTPEWVDAAILEANKSKRSGLPSLNFLRAILDRWRVEGFEAPFGAQAKGQKRGGDLGELAGAAMGTREDPGVAERIQQQQQQAGLRRDWRAFLAQLCEENNIFQLTNRLQAELRQAGREDGTWLVKANAPIVEYLRGRLPAFYGVLAGKVKLV